MEIRQQGYVYQQREDVLQKQLIAASKEWQKTQEAIAKLNQELLYRDEKLKDADEEIKQLEKEVKYYRDFKNRATGEALQ